MSESLTEFFAMGGYGLYVWGSFVSFAGVMVWNIWAPRARYQAVLRRLVEDENLGDELRGDRRSDVNGEGA